MNVPKTFLNTQYRITNTIRLRIFSHSVSGSGNKGSKAWGPGQEGDLGLFGVHGDVPPHGAPHRDVKQQSIPEATVSREEWVYRCV